MVCRARVQAVESGMMGGDWLLSPPPRPMWLSARRGQKGSVCGPATWRGSKSFSCVSVMRGTMSPFLSPKAFQGPLHRGMGGPERQASLEPWAQVHHRFIPECTVLGCCKVTARLPGSPCSSHTASLEGSSAPGIFSSWAPPCLPPPRKNFLIHLFICRCACSRRGQRATCREWALLPCGFIGCGSKHLHPLSVSPDQAGLPLYNVWSMGTVFHLFYVLVY